MGRFVNADAFTSSGQGFLGNNMFSYCLNNPLSYSDSMGCWGVPSGIANPNAMEYKGGPYMGHIIPDSVREQEAQKRQALNPSNTSADAVLQADYFAFYRGIPVIRTNGNRSGSFGIIFLTRETNYRDYPEDMLRHEYGHVVQLCQLGVIKYLLCIFIPSWQKWGSDPYYEKPWEITADIYGGVIYRNHPQGKIDTGFDYLDKSMQFGIYAWTSIS